MQWCTIYRFVYLLILPHMSRNLALPSQERTAVSHKLRQKQLNIKDFIKPESVSSQVFAGQRQSWKSEKIPEGGLRCKPWTLLNCPKEPRLSLQYMSELGIPSKAHFQDEHPFPQALQEPGCRHWAIDWASSLISLKVNSNSQDLNWGTTLQF